MFKKLNSNARNTLGLTIAAFGQTMLISLTSLALPMFFTDVAKINPATVSTIFLITKIWDAVNDPMMGVIVDKTKTRYGKCRPYLLFGAVPLGVLGVLMFIPVGGSDIFKFFYALLTYALFMTAFTAVDIPMAGIKPLLFTTPDKRNKAMSISTTFGSLGSFLAIDVFFALVSVFGQGNDERGYLITVIILCVTGAGFLIMGFFSMAEIVPISGENIGFIKAFKMLFKNKPFLVLMIISVVSISNSSYGVMLPYFAKWNLQDNFNFGTLSVEAVIFPLLNMVNGVIYMVTIFITPYLLKWATKKRLFMIIATTGLFFNIIAYLVGYANFWLFLVMRGFAHIPHGMLGTLAGFMIADTLDYVEYKTGRRTEGVTFAINNLVAKISFAVFNSIMLLMLGYYGYKIGVILPSLMAGESINQNYPQMLKGIYNAMTLFPILALALQIMVMPFYKFTDSEHARITEELKIRRRLMVEQAEGVSLDGAL